MKTTSFEKQSILPVTAAEAFEWHERKGAFERLCPPWDQVELIYHEGIHNGQKAAIRLSGVPMRSTWIAEHRNYRRGECFEDVQTSGPFSYWEHRHSFEANTEETCRLTDAINYRLPGGAVGAWLLGGVTRRKLGRMFDFRHRRTFDDLVFWNQYRGTTAMKILITGGTGLVGSELRALLSAGGHQPVVLTRSKPSSEQEQQWDPSAAEFDPQLFAGADAIVHLAGANIAGKRWSKSYKLKLRDSRVNVTRKLASALLKLDEPPKVLVSASAIGWYGDRGDEELTEAAEPGNGFLPDLCRDWEAASQPVAEHGIRVVNPRLGVVLSPRGGALQKMLFPFRMCAGGVIGSGRQWMSWVGIDDVAAALAHAVLADSLKGPVNLTSPVPATNYDFTKTLGRVLGRPTILPMPGLLARLAFGEMADALLLSSARVVPEKLRRSGYVFRHPDLETCLRHLLGR